MVRRRRFSAEYKREAVAMLNAPGVSVSPIAAGTGDGSRRARAVATRIPSASGAGVSRPRSIPR
jgi:hypothetical protein